jgi:hypothetical protein
MIYFWPASGRPRGGRYRLNNLVPACSGCNKHRSDKSFAEVIKKVKVAHA